jgi:acyl-CoA hydrolase
MEHLGDGSVIQLGIGGMPNAIGEMIARSDLKDLGGHTEMLVDAYVDMYESGVMTGMGQVQQDLTAPCPAPAAGLPVAAGH